MGDLTKSGLGKMNHESLDNLALETFATPLPEGLTKDEKVEMLLQMQAQQKADQQDNPADSDNGSDDEQDKPDAKKKEATHVYVRIANQEGVGGDQPVFLSVNGFPVLIHREKWVKLRTFFLPALQHATETHFFQNEEGVRQQKDVRRFNVEVRSLEQGVPDDNDVMDLS